MSEKKSPLRDRPLRLPGQSLQEYIDLQLSEKYDSYAMISVAFIGIAIYDWIRYALNEPLRPWITTLVAAVLLSWSTLKILQLRKKIQRLKLGRDGERAVAEILDKLRETGAVVFHDVKASDFNVDHVIACRQGIFVVETKTYSKRRGSKVSFDGEKLLVDGFQPTRDPVDQARLIARWVAKTLREGTSKTYDVKPVLVFPGWFVNPVKEQGNSDVWVLNPEALPKFVSNAKDMLSEEDFRAAAFHLSRLARSA
ncbi:MAG TPA: nuclease-related domain-containing protein [Burkholderiales bacterium]|nr:nuclease-related domain-containing protein [Burkholderiales bacterium]